MTVPEEIKRSPTPDIGASCGCAKCMVNSFDHPTIDFRINKTAGEINAELWRVAEPLGWANAIQDGEAMFVCPACIEANRKAMEQPLDPYNANSVCPKCGSADLGTEFCNGRKLDCTLGAVRDHLHRKCKRCGYDLIQSTNERVPWLTRLKRFLFPSRTKSSLLPSSIPAPEANPPSTVPTPS